jgi:hypothetical protein
MQSESLMSLRVIHHRQNPTETTRAWGGEGKDCLYTKFLSGEGEEWFG